MSQDVKKLAPQMRRRVQEAIESRLTMAPERYGVPLAGTLRDYSKLRVGDYRVIFQVRSDQVWVLAIVQRRDAHERAERRT